jgi:hypothetical protein
MKALVLMIMLIALFLLFRIAFPKRMDTKREGTKGRKREGGDSWGRGDSWDEENVSEVVVKSRFVRPVQGQPQPTHTGIEKSEYQEENASIFAAGNEKRDAVIPPEKLDEVFDDFNPDELEIPPDDDQPDETETDLEEEGEELRQTLGQDAGIADGMTIEEMTETVAAIVNPTDEKAELLFKVEKTDMFEKLVSGNEGKAARIKAVIDRFVQVAFPETESDISGTDYDNFDIER